MVSFPSSLSLRFSFLRYALGSTLAVSTAITSIIEIYHFSSSGSRQSALVFLQKVYLQFLLLFLLEIKLMSYFFIATSKIQDKIYSQYFLPFGKVALGVWSKGFKKPVLFAFGQKNRNVAEYLKTPTFFRGTLIKKLKG